MKNFPRTFKVFYIFLVLCFILVSISSGKRRDKGYWMDVIISPNGLPCTAPELQNAVLRVDTTDSCKGAFIPYAFKSLYINTLEHCFDLPEPLFEGSGITVQSVEVGCKRDRHTGEIVEVQFWLKDTEQKYYRTKILELANPVLPDPIWFMISVNHCFEVYPQTKKGKKQVLGSLSVGTIVFCAGDYCPQ
jgi:hypothetical protein